MNRQWSNQSSQASKIDSRRFRGCLATVPWAALLAAALFVAGLVCFTVGAAKVGDYTVQVADAISVAPSLKNSVRSGLLTAILAISIAGFTITALVVLQALWRLTHKSQMWGGCPCSCGKPAPWQFTAYRGYSGLLSCLMWLLLLAVVGMMMFMLLWLGGSVAVNTAITQGTNTADSVLAPLGANFNSAADASAAAVAFLTPLVSSPTAIETLLGSRTTSTAAYAFQPVCPPVCLNLGSFAMFMQSSSCICGSEKLRAIQKAAQDGTRVAILSLAGAFAMYVASTLLLIILTKHYVEARFDRTVAMKLTAKQDEEYENGYAADPADCIMVDAPPQHVQAAAPMHMGPTAAAPMHMGPTAAAPMHMGPTAAAAGAGHYPYIR